jgi:hypothetical protein
VTLCSQPKSSPFWINLVGTWLAREWPVKRRRKGVNGDGGVNLGSLELNDFPPAIERDGTSRYVLARVPDRGFGAEKFIEVFALDVLSIHQAIDSDAKRESHHCGTRKPAGVTPQTPAGG